MDIEKIEIQAVQTSTQILGDENINCRLVEILSLSKERKVLEMLGSICIQKYPNHPNLRGIIDGEFTQGERLDIDSDGNIILRRFANGEADFVKGSQDTSVGELIQTSLLFGGGNGIPTSASKNWKFTGKLLGIYKIPIADLYREASLGNLTIGNLSESEIVLSPKIAGKYLHSISESGESDIDWGGDMPASPESITL